MGFSLAKLKPENWSRDIAMDLGTASVLVFVEGKGIVLNEPSVVAVDTTTDRVVKVGRSAMEMLGRTPEHIEATRPLADGTMTQYEVTLQMLKYFIRRACGRVWIPPRVIICVPTGISEVQMRAIMDASREAGARRTYLIDEPRAAALGARLKFRSPVGHMIVNIGGGISNVAVLSMGGVVVSDNIPVGGDRFDQAIMNYVRRRYGVLIGERTAEDIKIQIGHVFRHERPLYMRVCGRSLAEGLPREILLSSKEMIEALAMSRRENDSDSRYPHDVAGIAMCFREITDRLNQDASDEAAAQYVALVRERERLQYYISLLEHRESTALKEHYFFQKSWTEIAKNLGVTRRTVYKICLLNTSDAADERSSIFY